MVDGCFDGSFVHYIQCRPIKVMYLSGSLSRQNAKCGVCYQVPIDGRCAVANSVLPVLVLKP